MKIQIDLKCCIIVCALTLLAAFRWEIGTDYLTYSSIYQDEIPTIQEWLNGCILPNIQEYGFSVIEMVAKTIGLTSQSFLMILAIIDGFLLLKFIKRINFRSDYALLMFYCTFYFPLFFNVVRVGLAILIVLAYGVSQIEKGRFSRYFLIVLIATTIHYSAIIFVLLPLFSRKYIQINLRLIGFLILIMALQYLVELDRTIILSIANWLGRDRYMEYVFVGENYNIYGIAIFCSSVLIFLLMLSYVCRRVSISNDRLLIFLVNGSIIGLVLQLLLIRYGATLVTRVTMPLNVLVPFAVVMMLNQAKNILSTKDCRVLYALVISVSTMVLLVTLWHNSGGVVPYKSFLTFIQ